MSKAASGGSEHQAHGERPFGTSNAWLTNHACAAGGGERRAWRRLSARGIEAAGRINKPCAPRSVAALRVASLGRRHGAWRRHGRCFEPCDDKAKSNIDGERAARRPRQWRYRSGRRHDGVPGGTRRGKGGGGARLHVMRVGEHQRGRRIGRLHGGAAAREERLRRDGVRRVAGACQAWRCAWAKDIGQARHSDARRGRINRRRRKKRMSGAEERWSGK